jgi:hypothetical protein
MRRIFHLDVVTEQYANGITLSLPADFGLLEEAIREMEAVEVYFDALMGTIDMKYDAYKGRDARAALQPLSDIANRTACNITGNVHFNKSASSDPAARILNSVEIRNVARGIIYLAVDRDGTRVLSRGKGNLGPEWPPLEYAIEDASFTRRGEEYHPGLFVLGDESAITAEDILRAENKGDSSASKITMAAIWLVGYMAEHGNKVEVGELKAAAAGEGVSWATVEKAKKLTDVESSRIGFGRGGTWYWYRTNADAKPKESPKRARTGVR